MAYPRNGWAPVDSQPESDTENDSAPAEQDDPTSGTSTTE